MLRINNETHLDNSALAWSASCYVDTSLGKGKYYSTMPKEVLDWGKRFIDGARDAGKYILHNCQGNLPLDFPAAHYCYLALEYALTQELKRSPSRKTIVDSLKPLRETLTSPQRSSNKDLEFTVRLWNHIKDYFWQKHSEHRNQNLLRSLLVA